MDTREINRINESASVKIAEIQENTLIPHIVMAEMLETTYDNGNYGSRVASLKNYLRGKHGIFLKVSRKAGYVIVPHGDEIDLCEGKCVQGVKMIYTGVKQTTDIRLDKVPEPKKQKTITTANKWGNIIGMLRLGRPVQEPAKIEEVV